IYVLRVVKSDGTPLDAYTTYPELTTDVPDVTPPTVVSITLADPDPTNAVSVDFIITFDEPVIGVDAADFSLASSVTGASVTGVAGSGPYTVTVDTGSGDGTLRLDVPGTATITDASANPLSGLPYTIGPAYTIDKTAPSVISITRVNPDPTNSASVDYTVTFDESVIGVDAADFSLSVTGAVAGHSVTSVSGSGNTRTVSVDTGTGDGTIRLDVPGGATVTDPAGNNLFNALSGQTYTVDKSAPTVTSITLASANPTNAASIDFTVTFSESVSAVDTADFSLTSTVTGASITGVSGSGPYTVSVDTGTGDGSIRLDVPITATITDAAGNALSGLPYTSGSSYTVDKSAPTVTSITLASANPTNAAAVNFTVTFSEPVNGVATGNFTATMGGAVVGAFVSAVTGTPPTVTWTVTVDTGSGDGSLRLDLTAAGAVVDTAANPLSGLPFTTGESYTVDKSTPSVSSVSSTTPDGTYGIGTVIDVTVTFSETVVVTGTPQLTLATGGPGTAVNYSSGSGTNILTFSYTVAAGHNASDLDYTATTALALNGGTIQDLTGNNANTTLPSPGAPGSLSNSGTLIIDTTPPTVSSIALAGPDPTNAATVDFTVTFSEFVVAVDTADFTLTSSVIGAFVTAVSGSGASRTVTVNTGSGDGTLRLDIPAGASISDSASNNLTGLPYTTGPAYTVEKTVPTVTNVTSPTADGTYNVGGIITVTVTFSEPVTIVGGPPQLTLATGGPGTLVDCTGGSGTDTLSFTYTVAAGHASPDLDVTAATALTLNGATIEDAAGNAADLTLPAPGTPGSLSANKALVIITDSTPPVAGAVNDGPAADVDFQNNAWQISANWTAFTDPESGITDYEWAIGTTPGGTEIQPFTTVGLSTVAAAGNLSLAHGITYYVTVRATNGGGLTATAGSDGITVDLVPPASPTLLAPTDAASLPGMGGVFFDWTTVPDAVTYGFQLDTEPSFSSPTVLNLLMSSTNFTSGTLTPDTYYWRVWAVDAAGNAGAPSVAFLLGVTGSNVGSLIVTLGPASPPPSNELNTAQDLSMMQLRLTAGPQENVLITSLRISGIGTGDEALHVADVRLFHDLNANGRLDAGVDLLLAGPLRYPVDDGSIPFAGLNHVLPAGESRDWIVVYSLSGSAPVGLDFAARLAIVQDVGVVGVSSGQTLLASAAFPIDGALVTIVPSGSPGALSVTPGFANPAGGFIALNEQTVEMAQLELNASSVEAVRVTALQVHGSGTGNDRDDIATVYLARDANGNGVFNAGIDAVLAVASGSPPYSADDGIAAFAFDEIIPAGTRQTWLVVYDFNGTGINGSAYTAEIRPAAIGEITAVGITSASPIAAGGTTFAGGEMKIGTQGVDPGQLTIGNLPVTGPLAVAPFAHNVWTAAFELTAGGLEDVFVQQVRITSAGTADEPRDISRLHLWEDTDGDAAFSPADRLISSLQIPFKENDGTATFVIGERIAAGSTARWLVTMDLSGLAADGSAFQTFFEVTGLPLPVLATGAASNQSITPSGDLVSGPQIMATTLVGSSGHRRRATCGSGAPSEMSFSLLALIALLAWPVGHFLSRSSARAFLGSYRKTIR
ncbi:MAG: hypothetical protein HYY16_17690, partial [Planctomycetes bacterium]|nr:hypothetical protein [Planctomycetota bacterium]